MKKKKKRKYHSGGEWTQERKDIMSKSWSANRPTVECPNCGAQGSRPVMKRWHFDNCKHNKASFLKKLYIKIWYKLSPL